MESLPPPPAVTETITETEYAPCACGPFGKPVRTSRLRRPTDPIVWNTTSYDELGRVTQVVHAPATGTTGSSGTTTFEYEIAPSGLNIPFRMITKTTDPAGRWKKRAVDEFGDLREVVEPRPGGGEYLTKYTYKPMGLLWTVSMERDGTTQSRIFEYNNDGSLWKTILPETGTTVYEYSGGKILKKTDTNGRMLKYFYNSANQRLERIERWINSQTPDTVTYNTTFTYTTAGRLSTVTYGNNYTGAVTEGYSYTAAGQLRTKIMQHPWGILGAEWTYKPDGRPDVVVYPSGRKQRFRYDEADRNTSVTNPDDIVNTGTAIEERPLYAAAYDWAGRMTGMQDVNRNWQQGWSYHDLGQMTAYGLIKDGSQVGVAYDYGTLPAAGKLASMTTSTTTTGQTVTSPVSYAYDSLSRLSSATAPAWSQTFTYDGFGNLTNTQSTGAAQNMYPPGVSGSNSYDIDGRKLFGGLNGTERYVYDSGNMRVLRYVANADFISPVREVTFWMGSQRIGVYQYTPVPDSSTYQISGWNEWGIIGGRMVRPMDRLGSDLSGGRTFLPYGQELGLAGNATNSGANGGLDGHRFATYWRDNDGIDYAQQRFYWPGMGKFLTPDPYQASAGAENPGSWNRLTYTRADPVNYVDPNGLQDCPADFCTTGTGEMPGTGGIGNGGVGLPGGGDINDLPSSAICIVEGMDIFYGGGGIEAPATVGPYNTSFLQAIRIALSAANKIADTKTWRTECEDLLKSLGTNGAAISSAAANVLFFEGPGSTVLRASLYANSPLANAAVAAFGSQTLADYFSQPISTTATKALADLNGNRVFLDQRWWGGNNSDEIATVMHELIHNSTGLTDDDFERNLPSVKGLSNALKTKCF